MEYRFQDLDFMLKDAGKNSLPPNSVKVCRLIQVFRIYWLWVACNDEIASEIIPHYSSVDCFDLADLWSLISSVLVQDLSRLRQDRGILEEHSGRQINVDCRGEISEVIWRTKKGARKHWQEHRPINFFLRAGLPSLPSSDGDRDEHG